MFQYLSNVLKNSSMWWVLTLKIALWKFKSPPGLQLPKWEFLSECEGLFPHTLLNSWEHVAWLLVSLWPATLQPLVLVVSPRLGLWQYSIILNIIKQFGVHWYKVCIFLHGVRPPLIIINLLGKLHFFLLACTL
jgi:hypothetical protein